MKIARDIILDVLPSWSRPLNLKREKERELEREREMRVRNLNEWDPGEDREEKSTSRERFI